ncbi:MAG TPA: hypothetical protein VFO55_02255 [Gemmatimonadaceae bacterium]|nr:hypothetical protein [Gemmatimonadaceae bacterium]
MLRSTSRVILTAVASATLVSTVLEAQIVRRAPVRREPNWGGVSVGIAQGYALADGSTNATWSFGSGLEYAGRFEHPLRSGIAVGVQAAYARPSLTYSSPECTCDATATVTQLVGVLHYGRGYTFHPVYELAAGVIGYSNFRRADDATVKLGSGSTDYDFRISIGYGLGFGVAPNASIEVVQEFGTILHQKTGLAGSSSSYPRVYVTRLGGKIAF